MYNYRYDTLNFEKSKLDNVKLIDGLRSLNYPIWGHIDTVMKNSYKAFMEQALELEQSEIIEKRRSEGLRNEWLYRNGTKAIILSTRLGAISIKRPQLRKRYSSTVLPQYTRKEQALLELITDLYTVGVSTRKMETGLQRILGEPLSAGSVSTITNKVTYHLEKFHKRAIPDKYVYLFLDGVPIKAKASQWEKKKGHMVLVAYGITTAGIKEIIDFQICKSESNKNCGGFIFDLYERGLKGKHLKLIITDGAKGFHNAIDEIYPRVLRQRCWVHKLRNIAGYVTKPQDKKVCIAEAKLIYLARNRKEAVKEFKQWKKKWKKRYETAVNCLEKDLEEMLNFFYFDKSHRIKIRTTNPIERTFREFKRRTKVMDNYLPNMNSCEKIFFTLTRYLNKRWKTQKYLHFQDIQHIPDNLPLRKAA